jgi:hypothetical protein
MGHFVLNGYLSDFEIQHSMSVVDVTCFDDVISRYMPGLASCIGTFTMDIVNMELFCDMTWDGYKRLLPGIREAISKKIVL